MLNIKSKKYFLNIAAGLLSIGIAHSASSLTLSQSPLFLAQPVKPLVMLNMSNDHQLYFKAYDDYTDLDGDKVADTTYLNSHDYYGYFDSNKCYAYNSATSIFEPKSAASDHKCTTVNGGEWSGNFLNWVSMTRMDAVRKILYGGQRAADGDTASVTILERAYIPSDAHAFAKYYNGADLPDLTPYSPAANSDNPQNEGVTFCNVTYASTGLSQNITAPPLIRVAMGNYSLWASNQAFQCMWGNGGSIQSGLSAYGLNSYIGAPSQSAVEGFISEYVARVKVCDSTVGLEPNCRPYPSGNSKPAGLLQEYGEKDEILFGLLTGSYQKNKSGGVLRKRISGLSNEIATQTDGSFVTPATGGNIIGTLNKLRISRYDHSNGWYVNSDNCNWGLASFGSGSCSNWGNPQAEIYLESLKYFAGEDPTTEFSAVDTGYIPDIVNATWDDPITSENHCAVTSVIQFNASTSSYDSDELGSATLLSADNIATWTNKIGAAENIDGGSYFVGESGSNGNNQLCTAKTVSNLSDVRGTCPDAPRLGGSYNLAGLAYYARANDILPDITGTQNVTTYGVALAPAVPKVDIETGSGTVTILPACRNLSTVTHGSPAISVNGNCAIVDFKIIQQSADGKSGTLYVNWEDSEQGGDYDLDMWGIIQYETIASSQVKVTTKVMAQAASHHIGFGYVISGTQSDGFHVHSGINEFFMTGTGCPTAGSCRCLPQGQDGTGGGTNGICTETTAAATSVTYDVGASAAKLLEQPLYYAAKWGGYSDSLSKANTSEETLAAAIAGSEAENYFYAIEPSQLEESLGAALRKVQESAGSAASVAANSTRLGTDTEVYQAMFNSANWTGTLSAQKLNFIKATNEGERDRSELGDVLWTVNDDSFADASTRNIATTVTTLVNDVEVKVGRDFSWANLDESQKALLNGNSDNGESVVNWIRGQAVDNLRPRSAILGDVVNSSPVYSGKKKYGFNRLPAKLGGTRYLDYYEDYINIDGRKNVVYVGANDGMLHGFDTADGDELFAYIPTPVYSKLRSLSAPNYGSGSNAHTYTVDGPIFVGDAYFGNASSGTWKNILVGTMGAGARGLFVLDVTDPANFNPAQDVLFEITEDDMPEIGNITSPPIVAPTQDGWKIIVGNGYNSSGETSALLVIDLNNPFTQSVVIPAGTETSYGLAGPSLLANGAGVVVAAYAGDLLGNMWKFDLSSSTRAEWGVAYADDDDNALPLFTAAYEVRIAGEDPVMVRQPITAPPVLGPNEQMPGATMVYFGTGSYLTAADNGAGEVINSVYALADRGQPITSRDQLYPKLIGSESDTTRQVSNDDNITWWGNKSGWYLDLSTGSVTGERVTSKPLLEYDRLLFPTLIPSSVACEFGGSGWQMELKAVGDKHGNHSIFGTDGKKSDSAVVGYSNLIKNGDDVVRVDKNNRGEDSTEDGGAPPSSIGRMSWRQIR